MSSLPNDVYFTRQGLKAFLNDTVSISMPKPFPKRQILDSSKLKGFADDNLTVDGNGRKFSKPIDDTVGKGVIAREEQFLLFPRCFQTTFTVDT